MKHPLKKKILRIGAIVAFLIAVLPGCELFEDCGTCSLVTYLDGNEVSRTPALPYCGDDYDEKKNDPGTYIGDNWAIWECE